MDRSPHRILVIDDDALWSRVVCDGLSDQGYDVHDAADGRAGLEATQSIQPDLVLCDWVMPSMDGPSYCRAVKGDPELRSIYVALMTARDRSEDQVAGLDAGADAFMTKPVPLTELMARVRSGLRLREFQHELVEGQHRAALIELATTLGHEINNPLTALFGHMELMIQYLESGDQKKMAHHIRQAGEVATRIAEVAQALSTMREPETTAYLGDLRMLDLQRSARRN